MLLERCVDAVWPRAAVDQATRTRSTVQREQLAATVSAHSLASTEAFRASRGTNHFSFFQIVSRQDDEYISTGDCVLSEQPHQWGDPV